jgi:hypothetical protein
MTLAAQIEIALDPATCPLPPLSRIHTLPPTLNEGHSERTNRSIAVAINEPIHLTVRALFYLIKQEKVELRAAKNHGLAPRIFSKVKDQDPPQSRY